MWAMLALFQRDPQPPNNPLFNLGTGKAFTKKASEQLCPSFLETGYNPRNWTGHSFRRGAAQHISDFGMLHHEIRLLGRWSSDAFKLYFTATPRQRLLIQRQLNAMASPSYNTDTFPTLAPPLPLA